MGESVAQVEEVVPAATLPITVLPQKVIKFTDQQHHVRLGHIESPSNLYVMEVDQYEVYERFQNNLNSFCNENHFPPSVQELPIGTCWCVLYCRKWHRATVLRNLGSKPPLDDTKFVPHFDVRLIDSGVHCEVSLNEVTYLDQMFQLDPPFFIPCCLAGVYPKDSDWSEEDRVSFKKFLENGENCTAIFVQQKLSKHYSVILSISDFDVTINELLDSHYGEHRLQKLMDSPEIDVKYEEESSNSSQSSPNSDILGDWNPMAEDFYDPDAHRRDPDNAELAVLGYRTDILQPICNYFKYGKECKRGDKCKYLHEHVESDAVRGHIFVEYLETNDRDYPRVGSVVPCQVLSTEHPCKFYLAILDAGDEAYGRLRKAMQSHYSRNAINPSSFNTFNYACGEVVCVKLENGTKSEYVRGRIVQVTETLALGNWYEVFLIDDGVTMEIAEKNLRPLIPRFSALPQRAQEAQLYGVEPVGDEWTAEAIEFFEYFHEDEKLFATIQDVDYNSGRLHVELHYIEDNDEVTIVGGLVDCGHAKYSSMEH